MIPGSAFPQRNHAYQPLDVPLPAAEERLYPSLDARGVDHRVLPPPVDAAVVVPSAPMYGGNSHAAQPRYALSASPMQSVNAQGYTPLRDEPQAMPMAAYQPGLPMPPPPIETPFICDHAGPPPSVDELSERINHSLRPQFSIRTLFGYSWRFFFKNFCHFCGTQILLLLILIGFGLLSYVIFNAIFTHKVSHHYNTSDFRKFLLYFFLIEYGFVSLFIFPLYLALSYAILRAIQTNRFLMLGEFLKFYSQHYCNFFGYSAFICLLVFPFFSVWSLISQAVFLFLFSFSALLKFQYPQMTTFKALRLSATVSLKNWPNMLGIAILLIVFNFLGALAFGFGLFITMPVTFIVNVYLYHKLVGLHSISGYSRTNGEYDGIGSQLDQPRDVQLSVTSYPAAQIQHQQQAPRVQYVQLVPMSMASAPGMMPPFVSAGAPGGPMVMRPSGVQNV